MFRSGKPADVITVMTLTAVTARCDAGGAHRHRHEKQAAEEVGDPDHLVVFYPFAAGALGDRAHLERREYIRLQKAGGGDAGAGVWCWASLGIE